MSSNIQMVYVTFPDEESAGRISRRLVEQGLSACANIHGPVTSIFTWNGRVQEDREYLVFMKTSGERMPDVKKLILDEHPYDVPCILSWVIEDGNPDFLDWVASETRSR